MPQLIVPGAQVRIHGLVVLAELNGALATVIRKSSGSRWLVECPPGDESFDYGTSCYSYDREPFALAVRSINLTRMDAHVSDTQQAPKPTPMPAEQLTRFTRTDFEDQLQKIHRRAKQKETQKARASFQQAAPTRKRAAQCAHVTAAAKLVKRDHLTSDLTSKLDPWFAEPVLCVPRSRRRESYRIL